MSKTYELRLGSGQKNRLDGGLCYDDEMSINISQSPYGGLLNMCLDDGGSPIKREGQQYIYQTSLGDTPINGLYARYKNNLIISCGGKLYKQDLSNQPIEIYSGVENSKTLFFTYNNILYMLDGKHFLQYDGTSVKEVTPYIPRTVMNKKPDGSQSQVDESFNLIGSGFKETFNGDGTSKIFKLSLKELDSTIVKCNIGAENNGFTVDRVKGEITFTTAPPVGTNNVEITAYKTFVGNKEKIFKCTFSEEFSNRIFISGNKDLPNYYFASGLSENNDVSYFPQKYFYTIKGDDKAITGFKVHYNKLIVFKEDLTATVTASTGLDNSASFPIEFLNTEIGCDIPSSIQLINNNVVFANTQNGLHMIVSTDVIGEKAIVNFSQNINGSHYRPGLVYEDMESLKKATSIDFKGKYYLNVGDRCYVWDYGKGFNVNNPDTIKWFLYDNINANCFAIDGNDLIYGHSKKGMLVKFNNSFNDFGVPIKALWRSKLIDFGYPEWSKNINLLWITCKNNINSNITLRLYDDLGNIISSDIISANKLKSFSWDNFSWDNFTWNVQNFAPTFRFKARMKKIRFFQFEIYNNNLNENLSIINFVVQYNLVKKVK